MSNVGIYLDHYLDCAKCQARERCVEGATLEWSAKQDPPTAWRKAFKVRFWELFKMLKG